jgi:hypothetical protein
LFLGYTIPEAGISMDSAEAIQSSMPSPPGPLRPPPLTSKSSSVILGLANLHRRFIKNFSQIIVPITQLLKKDVQFHWDRSANKAFETLKKAFTFAPVLRHFHFNRPVIVETDTSRTPL